MRTRCFAALAAAALLAVSFLAAGEPEPVPKKLSKEEIARAEKAVKDHLAKIKGAYGQVSHIADDAVSRALPGVAFFHVLYRQFPVGRIPPAGLRSSNVFAVGRDGKVVTLTDAKGLEKFVKEKMPAASSDDRRKDAGRAWVRLGQEFHQDGFYRFKLDDDSTKLSKGKDGTTVTARVTVMQGGNGTYAVELTFSQAGKLLAAKDAAQLRPGPRPICQATKLLDKDPIVRAMAEQALLCMGRMAKPYLDEQRVKASPQLRKAIDAIWKRILEQDE